MGKIKAVKKARIGIYTMGLKAYWNQFAEFIEIISGVEKVLNFPLPFCITRNFIFI